jgi:hypothetical protein
MAEIWVADAKVLQIPWLRDNEASVRIRGFCGRSPGFSQ